MASDQRQYHPLTCHGHSRPVPHLSFSRLEPDGSYYLTSACKDGNPILRDGITGDWIGTYIGHKGAVWQVRMSPDNATVASASADFTARIWDSHTGELYYTLQHDHIVRAIAYAPDNGDLIATGGMEKRLRIFDLTEMRPKDSASTPTSPQTPSSAAAPVAPVTIPASSAFEIGAGVHTGSIKFIVWTRDANVLVTASDNKLRWLDLPTRGVVKEETLDGEIKSCELVALAPEHTSASDIGGGLPVLAVAAGKMVYFWGGPSNFDEIKRFKLNHNVVSVGLDLRGRKFVVGEEPGTWARVCRWEDGTEMDILKGHHGPIWSIAFSPDGNLYATGSEDGTIKMWKNCDGFYGLWRGGGSGAGTGAPNTSVNGEQPGTG